MAIRPGTEIGGYTVVRRLGAGGMGTVYLAQHPRLPRKEALKILSDGLSGDPGFRARFEREADLAGGLDHPNIVAVHDRGETDDQLWIAMQYIDGPDAQTLTDDRGPLSVDDARWIIRDVAGALDYAHARGLLHRDVKPANILLHIDGNRRRALLSDFGIARGADSVALTGTGMAFGSAGFSSPEPLDAQPVDVRSDVYALGCTLYALLTGTTPYPTDSLAKALLAHMNDPPPRLTAARPDLPPQVDGVIARALAKHPGHRRPTAGALADDFESTLSGSAPAAPTIVSPPRSPHTQVRRSGPVSAPGPTPLSPALGIPTSRPTPRPPQPPLPTDQPTHVPGPQKAAAGPGQPPPPGPPIIPVNGRWIAALTTGILLAAAVFLLFGSSMDHDAHWGYWDFMAYSDYWEFLSALSLAAMIVLMLGIRPFITTATSRHLRWLLPALVLALTAFGLAAPRITQNAHPWWLWIWIIAGILILVAVRPIWFAGVLTIALALLPIVHSFLFFAFPLQEFAVGYAVTGVILLLLRSARVASAYLGTFVIAVFGTPFIYPVYPETSFFLLFVMFGILPTAAAAFAGYADYRTQNGSPTHHAAA